MNYVIILIYVFLLILKNKARNAFKLKFLKFKKSVKIISKQCKNNIIFI